ERSRALRAAARRRTHTSLAMAASHRPERRRESSASVCRARTESRRATVPRRNGTGARRGVRRGEPRGRVVARGDCRDATAVLARAVSGGGGQPSILQRPRVCRNRRGPDARTESCHARTIHGIATWLGRELGHGGEDARGARRLARAEGGGGNCWDDFE